MPLKIGTTNVSDINVTKNSSSVSLTAVYVKKNNVTTQVWGKRSFTVTVSNYPYLSSITYDYVDAGGYTKTGSITSDVTFNDVGYDEYITITATPKSDTAEYWYGVTGGGTFGPSSSSTIVQGSRGLQKYTITLASTYGHWENSAGTTIGAIYNVDYGTSISVVGNQIIVGSNTYTFVKQSDTSAYNYIFSGITNAPASVTGDVTITGSATRYSRPYVYIYTGTGVSSVYTSTSSTATSGNASGTRYDYNSTVYGFAVLSTGYNAPSGWTLVSGTAGTAGAKYRVGTKSSLTSNYSFGNQNATAKTYTIYLNSTNGYWTNSGGTRISSTTASYGSSVSVSGRTLTIGSSTYTFNPNSGYSFSSISGAPSTITGSTTITGTAVASSASIEFYVSGSAKIHVHYQNTSGTWTDTTLNSGFTTLYVLGGSTISMVSWSTGDGTYSLIKRYMYSSCEGDVYDYLGAYGYYYDAYNYAGKTTYTIASGASVKMVVSSETSQQYSFNQNIYTTAWVSGSEIQYDIPNDNTPSTSNNKFSHLYSGSIRAEYQTLNVYGSKTRTSDSWVVKEGTDDVYANVYLQFNNHGFANKISFYASSDDDSESVYFQYCNLKLR